MEKILWGIFWYIAVAASYKYFGPDYAAGSLAGLIVINGNWNTK